MESQSCECGKDNPGVMELAAVWDNECPLCLLPIGPAGASGTRHELGGGAGDGNRTDLHHGAQVVENKGFAWNSIPVS